jgi:glutamyl-tRNA synthetase
MKTTLIKTRFAPSPTGFIHLGNARTALFNALYAYHHHGIFLLRIEDTDLGRSTEDYAQQMMADLQWLGLTWQEGPQIGGENGPYYQSERNAIYSHYFQQLEQQGQVYPCFCTPQELALSRKLQRTAGQAPRYAGTCAHLSESERNRKLAQGQQPTLRFHITRKQQIQFTDLVRGQQYFASDDLGDFIIRRADGTPAFFFCNAIDDALMGVTHVFRGEDHLTNTPRQLLILQALELPLPNYGHISMILGDDGTPLSKRNGSQSIQELKNNGWLAEGVVNYLARLGHSYTHEEYLPFSGLVEQFAVEHLGRAPAHYDERQLHYWQRETILHSTDETLWHWIGNETAALVPSAQKAEFITAIKANLNFPQDALNWATILFRDSLTLQTAAQTVMTEAGPDFFIKALEALDATSGDYKRLIAQLKETTGAKGKALFMPLRAALTGEIHGPEMANLLPLIGIDKARHRLQAGL